MLNTNVTDWIPAPIRLGDRREFAIGDVHGVSTAFRAVLKMMREASDGKGHLNLLGDFIDRGPDSIGALRMAFSDKTVEGFTGRTIIMANHEVMHLCSIDTSPRSIVYELWLDNGGASVMAELGLKGNRFEAHGQIVDRLNAAVGFDVVSRMRESVSHRESGNLLFVHAGINPKTPLAEFFDKPLLNLATEDHCTWIRFPFLEHEEPFEGNRIVVHGHTMERITLRWKGRPLTDAHMLDGWRIGLDGGSYSTGIVAGAEFREGAYRVFTAQDTDIHG